jgi:hypothetical protein
MDLALANGRDDRATVPWTDIEERPQCYFEDDVIDDEHRRLIRDPSKMKKHRLLTLAKYLYDRQESNIKPPFRMKGTLEKEMVVDKRPKPARKKATIHDPKAMPQGLPTPKATPGLSPSPEGSPRLLTEDLDEVDIASTSSHVQAVNTEVESGEDPTAEQTSRNKDPLHYLGLNVPANHVYLGQLPPVPTPAGVPAPTPAPAPKKPVPVSEGPVPTFPSGPAVPVLHADSATGAPDSVHPRATKEIGAMGLLGKQAGKETKPRNLVPAHVLKGLTAEGQPIQGVVAVSPIKTPIIPASQRVGLSFLPQGAGRTITGVQERLKVASQTEVLAGSSTGEKKGKKATTVKSKENSITAAQSQVEDDEWEEEVEYDGTEENIKATKVGTKQCSKKKSSAQRLRRKREQRQARRRPRRDQRLKTRSKPLRRLLNVVPRKRYH